MKQIGGVASFYETSGTPSSGS